MKFSVPLSEFLKILQRILPAIPPKSTLPVLEHMYCSLSGSTLRIVATDQELTITSSLAVFGEEDGEILIPARRMAEITKALSQEGSLEVSTDDAFQITLRTNSGQYTMKGISPDEFPALPEFPEGTKIHFKKEEISRIANKTVFAVSNEEYRPAMTGVLFQFKGDKLNTVATDGYRLVRVMIPSSNGGFADNLDVIIPARAVDLLKKVDSDVEMSVTRTHAQFVTGDTTIVTRVIDEKFPPYENVIPQDNDKVVTLPQRDIIAAIKRVSIFANSASKQIRLSLDDRNMNVRGEDEDNGSRANENIPCDYSGTPLEIGFNHRYIEEALQNIGPEDTQDQNVVLTFSSATRAVLIKPYAAERENDVLNQNDNLLMLVMPVRLS